MKLPNGEQANLGVKLEDHVLNPLHREGRHKVHVFESVLGITLDNMHVLREALLDAAGILQSGGIARRQWLWSRLRDAISACDGERQGHRAVRMDHSPWRRLPQADDLLYRLNHE